MKGRLVVRDPATRRPLLEMTTGGMAAHDMGLLPDGRAVAIACCESVNPDAMRLPDDSFHRPPPQALAIRVTVGDAADGALKRLINVALFEWRYPCGIGFFDTCTWAVAGHAGGLFAFE
jgi:hypothetical protein